MSALPGRWERLSASLSDAGIIGSVSARAYRGGTSYQIYIKSENAFITISDSWWHDMWTGWAVSCQDQRTSLETFTKLRLKKRSEVLTAVRQALGKEVTA